MRADRPIKSTEVSIGRVALEDDDLQTLRALYAEAQQWSRHYESLIVNGNVLLVSVSLLLVGIALSDETSTTESAVLLTVPVLMALIGVALTETLFRLYATSVERMTLYENALACFDPSKGAIEAWGGRLLPDSIIELPVRRPASVRFFHLIYGVLITTYVVLGILKAV